MSVQLLADQLVAVCSQELAFPIFQVLFEKTLVDITRMHDIAYTVRAEGLNITLQADDDTHALYFERRGELGRTVILPRKEIP